MLELYHFYGAICGLKARIAVAEKDLPVVDHAVSREYLKTPEYLALNHDGIVPTLVHDGVVLTESTIIVNYLDDIGTAHPLKPADPLGRARTLWWLKRADACLLPIGTLTYTISIRPTLLAKSQEDLRAWLDAKPDPAARATFKDIVDLGFDNPGYGTAAATTLAMLSDMRDALSKAPWLAGDAYTLADVAMTPLIERLDELAMGQRWRDRFPTVRNWWERIRARASYAECVSSKPNPEAEQHTRHGREHADEVAKIFAEG